MLSRVLNTSSQIVKCCATLKELCRDSISVIAEDWTEEEERGERRGEIQVSRREEWPCDIKG